jgi:hypothetical protein
MNLPSDSTGETIVGAGPSRVNVLARTAFVAVVCAASAGVHAALVPEHYAEGGVVLGGAFALDALLLGTCAVVASRGRSWALPVVVLLGTALAYLLSRTTGVPGLIGDPEEPDALGLVTTVAEVVAAAVAAQLLHNREEDR